MKKSIHPTDARGLEDQKRWQDFGGHKSPVLYCLRHFSWHSAGGENTPKTHEDVKIINAGRILEDSKTLAESRVPVGEVLGAPITMHVVLRPPHVEKPEGGGSRVVTAAATVPVAVAVSVTVTDCGCYCNCDCDCDCGRQGWKAAR